MMCPNCVKHNFQAPIINNRIHFTIYNIENYSLKYLFDSDSNCDSKSVQQLNMVRKNK